MLIRIISLFFLVFHTAYCHSYNEEGWHAAGRYMREAIDAKANPCEDFYRYACGKWADKYKDTYRNEVDKAIDFAIDYLIKTIRAIRPEESTVPAYQKRLHTFFKQCVDATEEEEVILKEIYRQVEKIIGPMPLITGNVSNHTNPYKLMGFMQQYFNTTLLVSATVEREADGCISRPILTLDPAVPKNSHLVTVNSTLAQRLLALAIKEGGQYKIV